MVMRSKELASLFKELRGAQRWEEGKAEGAGRPDLVQGCGNEKRFERAGSGGTISSGSPAFSCPITAKKRAAVFVLQGVENSGIPSCERTWLRKILWLD